MKRIFTLCCLIILLNSCAMFGGGGKSGCPANSKAIGAEKIAAGDPAATKAASKAPKFKY